MRIHGHKALRAVAPLLWMGLTACVANPVADFGEGPIRVEVAVGDSLRVLTKDGERPRFRVEAIHADGLSGEGIRVKYDEMVFVETLTFSPGKTAAIGSAVILIIFAGKIVTEDLGPWGIPDTH